MDITIKFTSILILMGYIIYVKGSFDPYSDPVDWWRKVVYYQIYPKSYKDNNSDGFGDLRGVIQYMEHFVDAGIGAIWFSPIYKSPMVDSGYDISNFREVDPLYGTMEDFDEMIAKAKTLRLKVILDFVPNHASNESDYFKLSLNRTEGYEDFFIWDDGIVDEETNTRNPPSNWVSLFSGSAWKWRNERNQYYLHQFSVAQPDFNYRNPAVLAEMDSILRFWLDRGVDGFRVDTCSYLVEADKKSNGGRYPDEPRSYSPGLGPNDLGYTIPIYTKDLNESYDIIYHWRTLLDNYGRRDGITRVLLTEAYANLTKTFQYFGNSTVNGSMIPFNFDFITELHKGFNARDIVYTTLRWLTYVPNGKYPNWVLGNHDNSRMATRFGPKLVDGLNMFTLLLPGVAVTYQGDEIGMEDGYVSYEDTVDVQGCAVGPDRYQEFSRDPERTPFQWDNSTNAGFSNASRTWLPVAQNYITLNLANQKKALQSHFKVYQALTSIRSNQSVQNGDWELKPLTDNTFTLIRSFRCDTLIGMVFNVGNTTETVDLSEFRELPDRLRVYIASIDSNKRTGDNLNRSNITLETGEAVVFTADFRRINSFVKIFQEQC